jgi:hypothetical protein
MADLTAAVVVLIPASILLAAGMAYWAGRTLERSQQADSAQDDAADDGPPDDVFLATVTSPIGGERSLVIVDDGRNIAEAKRGVEAAQPAADIQDISRVRLFEFDQGQGRAAD